MKTIKSLILTLALVVFGISSANATVPWTTGTHTPNVQTSATPTCTSFSTSEVCILNMTANITALTLSGGTVGSFYTVIFQQDGTGTRTLTQTAITAGSTTYPQGVAAIPAITTAVNTYSVWVVEYVASGVYTLVASYDNLDLSKEYTNAFSSAAATTIATLTSQLEPTVVIPGMSVSHNCFCEAQTLPATWSTGLTLSCLPLTNAAQCQITNASSTMIAPTVITVNVRMID